MQGDRSTQGIELSVVIPVYRCADCLTALHERVVAACKKVTDRFEVVYVDDRSPDAAWQRLQEVAVDPRARAVRLSRNWGQQAAITAGLDQARGNWTVVMDCDLEDPPELIPELWAAAHAGDHEIVIARRDRRDRRLHRRLGARMYFWGLRTFLGTTIDPSFGGFSILSRKARSAFLEVRDADRHYIPILSWIGFSHGTIDYTHEQRYAGESSYNFRGLVRVALEGMFFHTTTLLRYVVYLGFAVTGAGLLLAAAYLYVYVVKNSQPGFTSLAVLVTCFSGFIIASMGVTGLYVGKIFQQVKRRPLYLVDESLNAPQPQDPAPEDLPKEVASLENAP